MKFSTRTTYGLRAMAYLARTDKEDQPVSLSRIAKEERISLAYLEHLFALLKSRGLVKAAKGAGGGYRLTAKPDKMNVLEIVLALEGNIAPFHCIAPDGEVRCAAKAGCGASGVLAGVYASISQTLGKMSLGDLV